MYMNVFSVIEILGYVGFTVGLCGAVYLEEVAKRPFSDWFPFAASSLGFAFIAGEVTFAYGEMPELRAISVGIFVAVETLGLMWALEAETDEASIDELTE